MLHIGVSPRRATNPGVPTESDAARFLVSELETVSALVNYHQWIFDEIRPFLGRCLAEVGGGIGTFSELLVLGHLAHFPESKLEVFEPIPELYNRLQAKFRVSYGDLLRSGRFVSHARSFPPAKDLFDTVIVVNVLEHIEDDVDMVRRIHGSLRSGGTLIVFAPALQWLYSALDQKAGHYRRYHKPQLSELLESCGFAIVKSIYIDLAGILPWYVVNVLGRSLSFNRTLAKLYDRYVVPATRSAERICKPIAGKNVLMVGQKR